jgi:tRNA(Ile)-lysidine synthase
LSPAAAAVAFDAFADVTARCHFPPAGDGPVDLAVSGGPDSMALVVLAAAGGLSGTVVHVDHGLRPGSAGEAAEVEAVARRFGFAFECHRVEVGPGANLEARARRARYDVLPPGVLTGHTMDDQVETVLLNLLRGAGLDGMGGMRAGVGRPDVRRPLLGLRRHETVEVCARAGVEPLCDPTNSDPRFRRNRVRAEVVPLLCDVAGRDVVPVIARSAALAADDAAHLDALAAALDPLDCRSLRDQPEPLVRRAVRAWLRRARRDEEQHPPSAAEVQRVMDVVSGRAQACELEGGGRVSRRSGRLAYTPR